MIEPQNTTMPLPAEPAQVDMPQGDGMGFGEMLAQTLGAAPAIDPNLVQRIETEEQSKEQNADNPSLPDQKVVVARRQVSTDQLVPLIPEPAEPGIDPQVPATSPEARPAVDGMVPHPGDGRPVDALPELVTPKSRVAPDKTPVPVDGLGKPVLTSSPVAIEAVAPAPTVLTPVDSVDLPVLTKDPEMPELPVSGPISSPSPDPDGQEPVVTQPVTIDDQPKNPGLGDKAPTIPKQPSPVDQPAVQPAARQEVPPAADVRTPVAQSNAPVEVAAEILPVDGPGRNRTRGDRQLPVAPTPTAMTDGGQTTPTATPAAPVVDAAPQARVDLNPEIPVRIDTPKAAVTPVSSDAGQVAVGAEAPAAPVTAVSTAPAAVQQTVNADVASMAAPTPHTALAERVLQAVELQANQPPPRTMVVDIPEIEGLRLVVSVRGGAQVHVVPTTGSGTSDAFQPFLNELNGVLSERGFVMTGGERERGHNAKDPDEQLPMRLQRPTIRRPIRNDNDLRI